MPTDDLRVTSFDFPVLRATDEPSFFIVDGIYLILDRAEAAHAAWVQYHYPAKTSRRYMKWTAQPAPQPEGDQPYRPIRSGRYGSGSLMHQTGERDWLTFGDCGQHIAPLPRNP